MNNHITIRRRLIPTFTNAIMIGIESLGISTITALINAHIPMKVAKTKDSRAIIVANLGVS